MGNAEELHDALLSAGYVLPQEFDSMAQPAWQSDSDGCRPHLMLTQLANPLWVATEQLPRLQGGFSGAAEQAVAARGFALRNLGKR